MRAKRRFETPLNDRIEHRFWVGRLSLRFRIDPVSGLSRRDSSSSGITFAARGVCRVDAMTNEQLLQSLKPSAATVGASPSPKSGPRRDRQKSHTI